MIEKDKLRKDFIKTITEDEDSYPDTNAGFKQFLLDKGHEPFNYRRGGLVRGLPKIAKRGF